MSGRIEVPKKTPQRSSRVGEKTPVQSSSKQTESLNDRVVIDKQGTTVAITVKTKKKDSSKMTKTPGAALDPENAEKSRKTDQKTNNWCGILREQNKTALKQSLQQINGRFSGSKTARPSPSDIRRPRSVPKALSDPPSVVSLASRSSQESVIVTDKGTQCGGIFDSSNKDFNLLNPIRTIGFLMKELENYVKDERSSAILFQMEQALLRIPENSGRIPTVDIETITKHTKLEASVAMLAATSREMQSNVEAMKKEKLALQHQIEEKNHLLTSAHRRETELETVINDLRLKLNESQHLELSNKKILSELKQKTEKIQVLHNLTTELKSELNEQTELAQQRFVEIQFLKMEKEKMAVMSSFKDTQLIEHRNAMKNLQNSIYDQLLSIKKSNELENRLSFPEVSLPALGRASSSPVHSISDGNSEIQPSFSTIVSNPVKNHEISAKNHEMNTKKHEIHAKHEIHPKNHEINTKHEIYPKNHEISTKHEMNTQNHEISTKNHEISTQNYNYEMSAKNYEMSAKMLKFNEPEVAEESEVQKFREKTHLEFMSLQEEASQVSVLKPSEDEFIYIVPEKEVEGESLEEKIRKKSEEFRRRGSIKEQIRMMYENTRVKSKFEVRVPSPVRNYPEPHWSDSSLPTMSISESNVII